MAENDAFLSHDSLRGDQLIEVASVTQDLSDDPDGPGDQVVHGRKLGIEEHSQFFGQTSASTALPN